MYNYTILCKSHYKSCHTWLATLGAFNNLGMYSSEPHVHDVEEPMLFLILHIDIRLNLAASQPSQCIKPRIYRKQTPGHTCSRSAISASDKVTNHFSGAAAISVPIHALGPVRRFGGNCPTGRLMGPKRHIVGTQRLSAAACDSQRLFILLEVGCQVRDEHFKTRSSKFQPTDKFN